MSSDTALAEFWERAKPHADLNVIPGYLGVNPLEVVRPNAWSFSNRPGESDRLLELVAAGKKTATSSDARWYDETTPAPVVGEMSILVNSHDRPRVLIVTTHVETVPFDQVSEEHARLEGEGDLSLAHWRETHERYFTENPPAGAEFSQQLPVLTERFVVLYQET